MIHIELDSGDINKLVKAGAGLSGKSFLNEKLSNFCLRDGSCLTFDQSFKMSTTPQVRLSEERKEIFLSNFTETTPNATLI